MRKHGRQASGGKKGGKTGRQRRAHRFLPPFSKPGVGSYLAISSS